MKTDVERIRAMHPSERSASDVVDLLFDDLRQAKRIIAALRRENEELREALETLERDDSELSPLRGAYGPHWDRFSAFEAYRMGRQDEAKLVSRFVRRSLAPTPEPDE